jgi:bifunctional non-homologous end joining protein LigD
MLAKIGVKPPEGEKWAYEFKWDGIRAICYWNSKKLRIESRNLINISFRFPELMDLGEYLGDSAIVDGEIIALDNKNMPSFSVLQKRMHISAATASRSLPKMKVRYYIFDLLFLNGENLMDRPYAHRRRMLEDLHITHAYCSVPPSHQGSGEEVIDIAREFGLEGIICKRIDSSYEAGKRSNDWIKVKLIKSREFIVGGFKYSQNSRNRIGSLQLGAFDDEMNLHFVGSMGTGFKEEDHEMLLGKLRSVLTKQSPFSEKMDRDVNFVTPVYVVQVEYRRWPDGEQVQQAAYKGLRTDKNSTEVKLKEQ